ncbi:MAG: hypothetical protein J3Q66DRAFT_402348 [Benniella sp.]|nr:MAG: hypothetical protein J3Q66DRAFT_402348 [Benniella sp.]
MMPITPNIHHETNQCLWSRTKKKSPKSSATSKATSTGSTEVYTGTAKGVSQLPVARVKRIIKEDKDVQIVGNEAISLISIATEIFLEGFTVKGFNLAKLEKRKTVLRKNLGRRSRQAFSPAAKHGPILSAEARTPEDTGFLTPILNTFYSYGHIVPKTLPLKDVLEKQRIGKEKEESGVMEKEDEGEQETNEQGDDSDEEQQQSASEDVNSSRPMSDDDELSGPDDMDED